MLQKLFGFVGLDDRAVADRRWCEKSRVAHDRVHEVVGHAHGVVGVLEEDRAVGFGVGREPSYPACTSAQALASSFGLHSMKSTMSGWSTLRMTILAARRVLPPDLMTPAKASKPFMKLSGPLAVPPPLRAFGRGAQGREIGAGADPHLKSMPSVLARVRMESSESLHRVDEARGALRIAVSGDAEFDARGLRIPVPVLGVGLGLDAVASDVEPDGRVEGGVLVQEDVREFVVEDGGVFRSAEVAAGHAPVADGFGDAGDQLADAGFALGRAERAMQIFAGHDVGGGHGPVFGDLDVFLLEDHVALASR